MYSGGYRIKSAHSLHALMVYMISSEEIHEYGACYVKNRIQVRDTNYAKERECARVGLKWQRSATCV